MFILLIESIFISLKLSIMLARPTSIGWANKNLKAMKVLNVNIELFDIAVNSEF